MIHRQNTLWPLLTLLALGCSGEAGTPNAVDPITGMPTSGAPGAPVPGATNTLPTDNTTPGVGTAPAVPGQPPPDGTTPGVVTPAPSPTTVDEEATLPTVPAECATSVTPGRAPVRRLTRFEYNRTVEQLLGVDTNPANALPAELLGNGFGNSADDQPITSSLAEGYGDVAEDVALASLSNTEVISRFAPCAAQVNEADEASCAQTFIQNFAPKAFRRNLEAGEAEDLLALFNTLRPTSTFNDALAGVIEGVLQGPDFLYRVEVGEPDAADASLLRPTGREMASRLSYLLWGSMPDDELEAAADAGQLSNAQGVLTQATRMLADERSRPMLEFFFDHYLPLNTLSDLSRDAALFPNFSNTVGSLMRRETQEFLKYAIFEGSGSWKDALVAPYTMVNEQLANFYGYQGITGEQFQRVEVDTTKRLGLLTQGGVLTGTTISNFTNPVRRGGYLLKHVMCVDVPAPPAEFAALAKPPDPYSGDTGRERYSAHSSQPECAGCHTVLDPPGFGLENYDAVGMWRDMENEVVIDASGSVAPIGAFSGPIEMVQKIANAPETHACFAEHWMTFAYGRALETADNCTIAEVERSFAESGYNIPQLLLSLTQTDAFLYLPQEAL